MYNLKPLSSHPAQSTTPRKEKKQNKGAFLCREIEDKYCIKKKHKLKCYIFNQPYEKESFNRTLHNPVKKNLCIFTIFTGIKSISSSQVQLTKYI